MKIKKLLLSLCLSTFAIVGFSQELQQINRGHNRPGTIAADSELEAWDKTWANDQAIKAAILLNDAEIAANTIELNVTDSVYNNYFVSSNGNDSNSGMSPLKPWRTIAKVNAVTLQPGDVIAFRRGDSWNETIVPQSNGTAASPIVYTNYGNKHTPLPVITGAEVLTGFTDRLDDLFVTQATDTVKGLYVDDEFWYIGRYPNADTFGYSDNLQNTYLVDDLFTQDSGYWNGGTLRCRYTNYSWGNKAITDFDGDTLKFSASPAIWASSDRGYYIDGVLGEVDIAEEWYCDPSTDTVYVFGDPGNSVVEGITLDYGFNIADKDYITIDGLQIEKHAEAGIYLDDTCSYITVTNCKFQDQLTDGIYCREGPYNEGYVVNYLMVDNCFFEDILGHGVETRWGTTDTVQNSYFNRIGLVQGYGLKPRNYDNQGRAIYIAGDYDGGHTINSYVYNNNIDSVGSCGISISGRDHKVIKNIIKNTTLHTSDAGAMYMYFESSDNETYRNYIGYNIIENVWTDTLSFGTPSHESRGIYIDGFSDSSRIEYNTVINTEGSGYYQQCYSRFDTLVGNVFYDCGHSEGGSQVGAIYINMDSPSEAGPTFFQGNYISGNKVYTDSIEGKWSLYMQCDTILSMFPVHPDTFGYMDYNYYYEDATSGDGAKTVRLLYNDGGWSTANYILSEWQTKSTQEANSKGPHSKYLEGTSDMRLLKNETDNILRHTFDIGIYKDLDGNPIGEVVLYPRESEIVTIE